MVGTTSNIYVSVTGPQDSGQSDSYRRSQHVWMISVEPHHSRMPGMPHQEHEPIHYSIGRNAETGEYTLQTDEVTAGPGIIGNILIVESTHTSPDRVHDILKQLSTSGSSSSRSQGREFDDDEPEYWIRRVIHGLQERKLAKTFDIDEFIMFAHGYVANRLENEAPSLIAYPKIHNDHEKKSSNHRFWISYPTNNRTRTNSSGAARVYGGLA